MGDVKCNKLPNRFGPGEKKWPKTDGYKNINVCSSAHGAWKSLSPMVLGPIDFKLIEDGKKVKYTCKVFENLWQYSKVWPGEFNEKTGKPTKEWYERRKKGWENPKGVRHVKKGKPLFSWWNDMRLSYFEARKIIYAPLYAKYVAKTEGWKKLVELVEKGQNIQLLGYDGYDFGKKSLKECFKDLSKPFGHELVLCCLLMNERVWSSVKIIPPAIKISEPERDPNLEYDDEGFVKLIFE